MGVSIIVVKRLNTITIIRRFGSNEGKVEAYGLNAETYRGFNRPIE